MALSAAAQGAGVLLLNARFQVTITAKPVKHLFHSRRQVGPKLVAGITGSTPAIINKIVVALGTPNLGMIPMFKVNRQHWMRSYRCGSVLID